MRTGIATLAGALASASTVLTAAVICAGAAGADPGPTQHELQDFFVTQLAAAQIPAVDNVPALVARAHQICAELDHGATVYDVVDEEMNGMFEHNPEYRQASGRVHRTAVRFIAVSIQVYCPSHMTDPYVTNDYGFSTPGPRAGVRPQTLPMAFASVRSAGSRSDGDARGAVPAWLTEAIPSGDITQPDPPQVPQPPAAQVEPTPQQLAPVPRPNRPPPPPQKPPPTPQQPPPPPQQVEPPAVGPQPGGAAGSNGGGSTGGGSTGGGSTDGGGNGGGPGARPSPAPGFVSLAP
ncbi:DUF732 domain-containing protein [Mycobacterium sp. Marseille-P9652]|uniref:DUF732 domain-containing protein n=1 Tax=Mycobacterium sp. Marseille-P9652 TaxID=2654950 RepID=UPI0018D02E7F